MSITRTAAALETSRRALRESPKTAGLYVVPRRRAEARAIAIKLRYLRSSEGTGLIVGGRGSDREVRGRTGRPFVGAMSATTLCLNTRRFPVGGNTLRHLESPVRLDFAAPTPNPDVVRNGWILLRSLCAEPAFAGKAGSAQVAGAGHG